MAWISDDALEAYQELAANVRSYLEGRSFHAPEQVEFQQRVRLEEPLAAVDDAVRKSYRG